MIHCKSLDDSLSSVPRTANFRLITMYSPFTEKKALLLLIIRLLGDLDAVGLFFLLCEDFYKSTN